MTTNFRIAGSRTSSLGGALKKVTAGAAVVAAVVAYVACTAPVEFVSAWGYKRCDVDRGDTDCIALADTYCEHESGLCRCWNEDGTKPAPNETGDQIYCQGACRPLQECSFTNPDAGDDAPTAASGAGGAGSASSGGAGGSPAKGCTSALECPGPPSKECGEAACEDGACTLKLAVGELASQLRGDCKRRDCDALGNLLVLEDPSDFFDDGLPCTEDLCDKGAPVNQPRPDGSYCTSLGSGYCWAGECVECISSFLWTYCPGSVCDNLTCVSVTCEMNNLCGGDCAPCPFGSVCKTGADCQDGVCLNGMCEAPSCDDNVQNDGEADVDCGGPCPTPCADGEGCHAMKDCASGVCWGGLCQSPTCSDGVMNGDEEGKDCGGGALPCPACP